MGATSGNAAAIVVAIADGGTVFDGAGVLGLRGFHQCLPPFPFAFACVDRSLALLRCELPSLAYILRSSSPFPVSFDSRLDTAASAAAASASSSAALRAAATGSKYVNGLGWVLPDGTGLKSASMRSRVAPGPEADVGLLDEPELERLNGTPREGV